MDKIKIIQMGLGTIGKSVTRSLLARRGVQIVGAIDLDGEKVGKDLGEVAGMERRLGVVVTEDAGALFSQTSADVLLHAVSTRLDEACPQITPAIEQGINVISSCEELGNPYASNPTLAAGLDCLARDHGATILGTGLSPGFTSDYLILALMGACSRVDRIKYVRHANASAYLGGVVGEHFGLGLPADEFRRGVQSGHIIGHIGFVESIRTIADALGWDLDETSRTMEPVHDERGRFVSTNTIARGMKDGVVKIEMELHAYVDPNVQTIDRFVIDGMPPIDVTIKPNIESTQATANAMVNAIPHVMNAMPGLVTIADLPLILPTEHDLRLFLR